MQSRFLTKEELRSEYNRQVCILLSKKFYEIAKISEQEFTERIKNLLSKIENLNCEYGNGKLPFAICFNSHFLDPNLAMLKVFAKNKEGYVEMNPLEPKDFNSKVKVPESDIYLITNIETGFNYLNISPAECFVDIGRRNRSPLTLEEGVMVANYFPEIFINKKEFNAIQMAGSRKENDQRVPSIWFSKGAPRLGWCWDNNIHTWFGTASCGQRI